MDLNQQAHPASDCRLVAAKPAQSLCPTDKQPYSPGFKVYDGRIRYALAGRTKRRTYEEQSSQVAREVRSRWYYSRYYTATKLLALEISARS
jgi:hypothetical protein